MDQMEMGLFISTLRKEYKMTQEQFAEKLGVSNRSVSRWENGKSMPDLTLMQEMCNMFEISLVELLDGRRKEETEPDDTQLRQIAAVVMELSDRDKKRKSDILNVFFGVGICFILLTLVYDQLASLVVGLLSVCIGFYYNIKGSRTKTFTPKELDVFTKAEDEIRLRSAEEMLQFARKYQKAEFRQYRRAFEEIAAAFEDGEYAMFTMVAESYTRNDSPGPWHISIAVTQKHILLAGEMVQGRMFTRYTLDRFPCSELHSIAYIRRKMVLKIGNETIQIEGEHMEEAVERLKKVEKSFCI